MMRFTLAVCAAAAVMVTGGCGAAGGGAREKLQSALLLHASYDESADADVAVGDGRIHTIVSKTEIKPGLARPDVKVVKNAGRYGGALHFEQKGPVIFYQGEKNAGFTAADFDGSFSVWVKLDPDKDLTGYCDPVQITDKGPTNEGIFIEFTKDAPRRFRMVAAPGTAIWNPQNRKYEEMPLSERPVVEIPASDFGREKWTHVVVTWQRFNTGGSDGLATLYVNGEPRGHLTGWKQIYNWDPAKTQIKVGLALVGYFDDFAMFNRALTANEVKMLHGLAGGVGSLQKHQ